MIYKCAKCNEINAFAVTISPIGSGNPKCGKCQVEMIEVKDSSVQMTGGNIENKAKITTNKAQFRVGGDFKNTEGELKSWDSEIDIKGDFDNTCGKLIINDPEKLKETLVEISKTAKNITEIGQMVA